MAFFNVTMEVISKIEPIPGADKIVKVSMSNLAFAVVAGKDIFSVGETVLYYPIDSVIPQSIQEQLGVAGRLSGSAKNRVKTVRLKMCYSQGLIGKFSLIEPMLVSQYGVDWAEKAIEIKPSEITEFLGVTKYEPPVIPDKAGNLKPLPNGLSVYDIEGCERFYVPLEKMMDMSVWVLEKLEGSNGSVSYDPISDVIFVNQRRHTIEEVEGHQHTWWTIARKQGFIEFVTVVGKQNNKPTTIYFEVVGPGWQGNIYHLPKCVGYIFDMKIGDSFVNKGDMFKMLDNFFGKGNYLHAPILSSDKTLRQWLDGKTIVEASNGESKLYPTLREGIVITPHVEQDDEVLGGRFILKQRCQIYLSKNEN